MCPALLCRPPRAKGVGIESASKLRFVSCSRCEPDYCLGYFVIAYPPLAASPPKVLSESGEAHGLLARFDESPKVPPPGSASAGLEGRW